MDEHDVYMTREHARHCVTRGSAQRPTGQWLVGYVFVLVVVVDGS